MHKTVVLCILDGWGHRENGADNAILHARTPNWNNLKADSPHVLLKASEQDVGLPEGQMGNSEVGHMNIGAGRIILQDLPRIDQAITQQTLPEKFALKSFVEKLKATKGTCHLLGLLSSGGVHSHERHLITIATILANQGIPIACHAFLDGRDTSPKSAEAYLSTFFNNTQKHPLITLATVGGRYFGMDRDKKWERVKQAYDVMVKGEPKCEDVFSYLQENYQHEVTDEFVPPRALPAYRGMKDGDGLFMSNFRSDRVRQILTAFLDPNFQDFDRSCQIHFGAVLGMVEYSETLNAWMDTLFPPFVPSDTLGEIIANQGLKQLRIAETEKYAHVTFFFNGGREDVFPGEDRILIPSPNVATYDLKPEMSAFELTDSLVKSIENQQYALIIVNYANTDMVGHTGNYEATQKAVEAVDQCLGRIREAVEKTKSCLLVTADHGNAEMMYDEVLQSPHTAHTLNLVPFLMFQGPKSHLLSGSLSDVAPTILQILGLPIPRTMTGTSLLKFAHA